MRVCASGGESVDIEIRGEGGSLHTSLVDPFSHYTQKDWDRRGYGLKVSYKQAMNDRCTINLVLPKRWIQRSIIAYFILDLYTLVTTSRL